jgi:hypothetical protein
MKKFEVNLVQTVLEERTVVVMAEDVETAEILAIERAYEDNAEWHFVDAPGNAKVFATKEVQS